jgi:hypothetical protein
LLLKTILASISSVIKARNKKVAKSNAFTTFLQKENRQALHVVTNLLISASSFSQDQIMIKHVNVEF